MTAKRLGSYLLHSARSSQTAVTPLDLSDCESYADVDGVVISAREAESDTFRSESAYAASTNSKMDHMNIDTHSVVHSEVNNNALYRYA